MCINNQGIQSKIFFLIKEIPVLLRHKPELPLVIPTPIIPNPSQHISPKSSHLPAIQCRC